MVDPQKYLQDLFSLTGRRVLVTGASSGLGEHFARALAKAGADVALAARRKGKLETLASELEDMGARAHAVSMDVTDPASVTAAFAELEAEFGGVDTLINNAGVSTFKPFLEHDEEDWEFLVGTNLTGAWRVARAAAQAMIAGEREGIIVNIASVSGLRAGGHLSIYSTAKAGLIHMTNNMALELARHNIRVNALAPGYFSTPMNDAFLSSAPGDAIRRRVPNRRFGTLDELDGALLLMCSPAGRHITGTTLAVDGGHAIAGM